MRVVRRHDVYDSTVSPSRGSTVFARATTTLVPSSRLLIIIININVHLQQSSNQLRGGEESRPPPKTHRSQPQRPYNNIIIHVCTQLGINDVIIYGYGRYGKKGVRITIKIIFESSKRTTSDIR